MISEEIKSLHFFNIRPWFFHFYLGPFVILYLLFLHQWLVVYGISGHLELGAIILAIIAITQTVTFLSCVWSVHIKCFMTCSSVSSPQMASYCKVCPTPNNGSVELVPIFKKNERLWFEFQKTKYIYDSSEKKQFQAVDFPVDLSVGEYLEKKGLSDDEVASAADMYGNNHLDMTIPEFMELFFERATAPFFVFQVFCVGLWCLDEYWYYSVFTLVMLVVFEASLVKQQLRNMSEIRKMGNKPHYIQTYRNRKWRPILSNELVPGDLVAVVRSKNDQLVPCDILLLRGSCIVDESLLTGEAVPVMKEPVSILENSRHVDITADGKLHVLYGGTKVVQHTSVSKEVLGVRPQDGCLGFVARNGFHTSQGRLLRTILFSVKQATANNLETFLFILFLLVFAIAAASYVWVHGTADPKRNKYKLFLECTLILTSVVPPELPIELSLAVNTSLIALTKLCIYCTEPFRIPFAGKVEFCCFDKTGTLTSKDLVVEGVAGLNQADSIIPAKKAPLETVQVLATCHALLQLDDQLIGDPLEMATLQAVDWNLTRGDAVVPRKMNTHGLKIFHRFHFASELKRMSVIAGYTQPGSNDVEFIITAKGAPETFETLLSNAPENYEETYKDLSRKGARVLALAYRKLGVMSHQAVRNMSRDQVETNLEFAGFVVISCPLKHDSREVIREIINASHNVVMITGDNPLTACHVSRELGISYKLNTLILQPQDDEWFWIAIDETVSFPAIPNDLNSFTRSYDLCLTGESLTYLQDHGFLNRVIPHVRVFARVAPKQKEIVITTLQKLGYTTLMCGDGTNDVAALKHAHVGISLLSFALPPEEDEGRNEKKTETGDNHIPKSRSSKSAKSKRSTTSSEKKKKTARNFQDMMKDMEEEEKSQVVHLGDASIASPFTSKFDSIVSASHIIKQGRCTLVTTHQMFKILALNALILAYSQSVLYLDGVKMSDSQATLQGLLLAGCFLFISRSKPLKVLSKERPLPNIFNPYTMLTICIQFAIHFASLIYLTQEAQRLSPPKPEFVDLDADFKPNLLNTTVYYISMSLQVATFAVNYKGHPFMESLVENKPLLYSLFISAGSILGMAGGYLPEATDKFELVDLPDEFRNMLVMVLACDILGAFVVDRVLSLLLGSSKLRT